MILVDSSVWIDYFRGAASPEADRLHALLGGANLLVGDLMIVEVLQGYGRDSEFNTALDLMSRMDTITIGGADIAVAAAKNFRYLRSRGITVRKTIDTLIATRCIAEGLPLLYSDRDFDPFVEHLGLIAVPS